MSDAERPAPHSEGGPKAEPITFQELWELLDNHRFESAVLADLHGANPDPHAQKIAAQYARRLACFETAMILIARMGEDDLIKDRLREIAQDEFAREAALAALDDPDKDDAT